MTTFPFSLVNSQPVNLYPVLVGLFSTIGFPSKSAGVYVSGFDVSKFPPFKMYLILYVAFVHTNFTIFSPVVRLTHWKF